jgi:hypothetical protein
MLISVLMIWFESVVNTKEVSADDKVMLTIVDFIMFDISFGLN